MSDGDGAAKEIGENATFVPTDVSITVKWFNISSQCFASLLKLLYAEYQDFDQLCSCHHFIYNSLIPRLKGWGLGMRLDSLVHSQTERLGSGNETRLVGSFPD